jgi:hypothetical protein
VVSVFDAAELNIWRLMDTDSFRRFQESPEAIALRMLFRFPQYSAHFALLIEIL